MQLSIRNLSFTYEGSYTPVFENLNINLDTRWRLGLVGRNGRGKTTLLQLMLKKYSHQGVIDLPLEAVYFPFDVPDPTQLTLFVMQQAAPDAPDWRLMREMKQLKITDDALYRPFDTLSKGEQTKALLCALFAREDVYPLIDEPTNHLDVHGRELVADYLRSKDGFLLVSHDRAFLNRCIDHVFSLNKSDAQVVQGDYDTWEEQFNRRNAYEQARNEDLKRDISRLTESARQAAQWSTQVEKGKFHVAESEVAALDRGYVGARAASMMKRSQNTLKRRERAIEEKQSLLKNVEQVGELKLTTLKHPKQTLISVQDARVSYDGRVVCENIRFDIRQGDRVALTGANGAGKSSVLKTLCGLNNALTGTVRIASGLTISYVPQETDHLAGSMRDFINARQLDETLFKAILRNMDFSREQFEKPLTALSQGQKKKILLAASLCTPAHLYIWDEPLNYIDVLSRIQVETLIKTHAPTLLLVEHDKTFLQNVCNKDPIEL
ncbi:MAG: ABC-F type ribosomal protection protein [Clostridia bacterium]|nr:ABC-F type ribosomal protection protein [Clostridia bacterium]